MPDLCINSPGTTIDDYTTSGFVLSGTISCDTTGLTPGFPASTNFQNKYDYRIACTLHWTKRVYTSNTDTNPTVTTGSDSPALQYLGTKYGGGPFPNSAGYTDASEGLSISFDFTSLLNSIHPSDPIPSSGGTPYTTYTLDIVNYQWDIQVHMVYGTPETIACLMGYADGVIDIP
jgi:hypothetical protein